GEAEGDAAGAAGAEAAHPIAQEPPNAGPLPEVPAANAPLAMRLAGSDATYGYLVFPSLHGAIARVKEIAKLVDENVKADEAEQGILQSLDLGPKALKAVRDDAPSVMIMLEPDMEEGAPKMVAVLPVTSIAEFRAALTTAPPPPPGVPAGQDPAKFAGEALTEKEPEPGIFTYSKMVEEFDWDAYEAAQKKAMDEGGDMPDMESFNKKREAVKFAVTELEGHALVSNAVEPLKAVRDAKQPETVPAVPSGDVALFVSAEKLRGTFKEQLEEAITEMRAALEEGAKESPLPTGATALKGMADGMEAVVREAHGAHMNVALGKPALRLAYGATFAKDGKVADLLRTQIHDGPDYVTALPADSLVVSASRLRYTDTLRKWANDSNEEMFKLVRKEAGLPDDPEIHKIADQIQGLIPRLTELYTGESAMALALSAEQGLDVVSIARVAKTGEAEKIAGEVVDTLKSIIEKVQAEAKKEGEELPVTVTVDHVLGAAEVAGTKVNMVTLSVKLPGDMPGASKGEVEMAQSVLRRLLGSGDTFSVYYAEIKDALVYGIGASAEARVTKVVKHLAEGTTEGPGGEYGNIAEGMGKRPTFFVYLAPLDAAHQGVKIADEVVGTACYVHQHEVGEAAKKFKTLNGGFPDGLWPLKEQDLLGFGSPVPCEDSYTIDPNSGAVRCAKHGTKAAPIASKKVGEALGIEWNAPKGPAGIAFYCNVFDRPEGIGAEFGYVSTLDSISNAVATLQPLIGALGGGGRGGRQAMNESAAIGALRSLAVAQEQFKQQNVVDQDQDGMGEYGFLGELAGVDACRGSGLKMNTAPFIAAILGVKDGNGIAQKSGYHFRVFLPGAEGTLPEGAGAAKADEGAADAQETRWCAYAWPVQKGLSGNRVFFVNNAGEVYATMAMRNPYSGAEMAPEANAAYEKETGANLDGGVGLAAAGLRSNDGNTWMPAGN
ncbi:MAG: hypothetical protein ACYTGX_02295, partial [Planctomycetota bacterium]